MKRRNRLLALNCAIFVQHGVVLLMNGPLVPSLMRTFEIGEGAVGFLLAFGSVGFMLGPIIAGTLIDRVGLGSAILVGFVLELIFLLLFGLSPLLVGIVIANFMTRLGASFIETSGNVMPTLADGKGSAHSRMNLVHVFFSVGALAGPFLIGVYLGAAADWRAVPLFVMIPTAAIMIWVLRFRIPRRAAGGNKSLFHDIAAALHDRSTVFGAISLMLYVGAEASMSSWLVLYLQRIIGLGTVRAASGLSLLWIAIMVGRYLNSLAGRRFSSRSLVTVSGIAGFIGVCAFIFVESPVAAYLIIGWIGLCLSGVFPNIMAELNNRNPERTGTTTAVMAIGASLGAALFQGIVGVVAGAFSLRISFFILGVLQALVVVSFMAALAPSHRDRSHNLRRGKDPRNDQRTEDRSGVDTAGDPEQPG